VNYIYIARVISAVKIDKINGIKFQLYTEWASLEGPFRTI